MRLVDVITQPWAIMPERLQQICEIYATHLLGEKIDIERIEASLGRPLDNEQKPYEVFGRVAVVPMVGVLAKRANMFMRVSGGASTQIVGDMLDKAARDPNVSAIMLEIDSPGGTVDGTQELAGKVAAIRASGKPVKAWVTGFAASGAYWIASAAGPGNILVADETSNIGSIGVVMTHVDKSKAMQASGFRTTEIVAGKYKRIATDMAPLTEEGAAYLQEIVDGIYQVFVEDVARGRGVAVEKVLADMAEGRLFIGRKALEVGLVDGVSTFAALVESMQPRAGVARPFSTIPLQGPNAMNRDELKAQHPDVHAAIVKEGRDAGVTEGATAERARIQAILDAKAVGCEDLTAKAIAEGMDAGKFALAVLASEAKQRQTALANVKEDADKAKAKNDSAPPDKAAEVKRAEFDRMNALQRRAVLAAGTPIVD